MPLHYRYKNVATIRNLILNKLNVNKLMNNLKFLHEVYEIIFPFKLISCITMILMVYTLYEILK